ncbi:MAG TPA: ABC transporter ATP-binding protein [Actinomycetes bacterium]|nr:ABC transporter ATP-binding protein [Actinomycetes bacterium]
MSQQEGSVDILGVTRRFGPTVAVDDLTLEVSPGEFLSLLGPSGCGKTTTLRLIAGFEHPDAGAIRISGVDVAGVPAYRRGVNTVFQHYALFPHMTVAENVAYGLRQKRVPKPEIRRRVRDALEMVDMLRLGGRRPRQLSGGQQQRVALARALVNRPAVLLLDEPLGALDRKLRQEMQIELKLLQTQVGITFVYVTHDQEEALSMSDRIAVMLDGRIQQLADPERIYDQPATAFVAGFIGQQNFFSGTAGGDGSEVACADATIASRQHAADMRPGQPAIAAVRPEHVRVTPVDPGRQVNAAAGRLASVAHLGEVIQQVVRLRGGQEVISRQARAGTARLGVGQEVWCTWEAERVHLFSGAQAGLVAAASAEEPVTEGVA